MLKKRTYKIPLLTKVVSLYVLVCVPLLVASYIDEVRPDARSTGVPAVPAAVPQPATEEETIGGQPVRLIIPRLNIDLGVVGGEYHEATGKWTLSDTDVHYALMTPQPSNKTGNTLMYGHNTRRVLAAVKDIRAGDTLVVKTANGHTLTYTYTSDNVVHPTDTAFLGEAVDVPMLTLLTCDGPWFEKRRLMSFILTEVT